MISQACPKLIDRFKEREENVKVQLTSSISCLPDIFQLLFLSLFLSLQMDVFNTFIELLRQTGNVTGGQMDTDEMRSGALNYFWGFGS